MAKRLNKKEQDLNKKKKILNLNKVTYYKISLNNLQKLKKNKVIDLLKR